VFARIPSTNSSFSELEEGGMPKAPQDALRRRRNAATSPIHLIISKPRLRHLNGSATLNRGNLVD